ncbi:FlgO family outer membrane protein [Rubrivivax gelatinosus]|uniref:FlgO family outer membrane protein n=1 Tax=Rubrivivax gelatinosus TaxID=28068 RepID=UPI0005C25939|nr:FlgO family outer membrane protein [Rubrivivax gelatinosus]MBG6083008.1 hypothetical protein [Rubrivivax gelatinosus]
MNRRTFLSVASLAPTVGLLSACEPETLFDHAQAVVDKLLPQLQASLEADRPILVAPFHNLDDLQTSTFGRAMAELVGNLLAQRGLIVADARLHVPAAAQNGASIALTGDTLAAAAGNRAQAVIVGAYSVMSPLVYASVKCIRTRDNQIIAATDVELRYEG